MQFKSFMEALKGNQHKLDKNKNGKVDAHDFKLLRKEEEDIEEGVDRVERADFKTNPSGRKSHKEITFKNDDDVVKKEEVELEERSMTDAEMKKREDYVKGMKKNISSFKDKYGAKAKDVMYATATKMAMKEDIELTEARRKVTHENPLVTVHDKDGLHTHADLETANHIMQTNVKHTDVHKGPVKTKSGGSYGNVTFALSQHHASDVKKDAHMKEDLDEALDPSEIAGNPKMYDAVIAKKAYYHKSASASDKESLARHLDRHHGNKEWRKPVKEDLEEAVINGREYASHGLMHPDHAARDIHKVTGSSIDFYAHGTGDKVEGKVTKNDGKAVHIKDTKGTTHKFKVQRGLPKQQNEEQKPPFDGPYTKTKPANIKEEAENIEEAESHQSKTTMKHIPNASPALKKAAKDIKPGVSGYRDRIAMLKAGGVKEETVAEAKDEQEYGYEGDMAMTQLETAIRHATHLKGMMKPDTDLPEWVQSKITLATDYLQTAHDYLMSELDEQAPVAPSLMKHRISVTVSDPDHTMVSKRKEKMQKTVIVTHSDNKEGAQKVGEKFYKKKGFIVHDSIHAGMVKEETTQFDAEGNLMAEKLKFSDFIAKMNEQLLEYESDDSGVYRNTKKATYGTSYQGDDDEDDKPKKPAADAPKRGRGRPAGSSGASYKPRSAETKAAAAAKAAATKAANKK